MVGLTSSEAVAPHVTEAPTLPERDRRAPTPPSSSPPSMADRGRMAGLTTHARHGASHMARIGQAGQDALSRRIAAEYGIPLDAPDYQARLASARRLYMAQVRKGRTSTTGGSRPRTPGLRVAS